MRFTFYIITALLSVSCSTLNKVSWPRVGVIEVVEHNKIPPKISEVIEGIKERAKKTGNEKIFSLVESNRVVFLNVGEVEKGEWGFCQCKKESAEICRIVLSEELLKHPHEAIEVILLHEIGHAFGLNHSIFNPIMRPSITIKKAEMVTQKDRDKFIKSLSLKD